MWPTTRDISGTLIQLPILQLRLVLGPLHEPHQEGDSSSLGAQPGHLGLGVLGSILGLFELLLSLPELGQVEGGDLLSVLDLLLESGVGSSWIIGSRK